MLVLAAILLTVPFGGVGAATASPSSGSATGSVVPVVVAPPPSGFGARAGYSPDYALEVSGASPSHGAREVVVTFQAQSPGLFAPPSPGSKPLTMSALADRFGLTPSEYLAAERYFTSRGLFIVHAWPDRLSLSIEGSVSAIDAAFGTALYSGSYGGRSVTYPAVSPTLPSVLESKVESIVGLSAGFDSFALPGGLSGAALPSVSPTVGDSNLVTPAIARDIYDLSALYNLTGSSKFATGEGIALVLWGPGYAPSDISSFFQQDYPSGFPTTAVVPKPVDGAPLPSPSAVNDPCGASQELTLDLEWSGSMAPGSALYAVYAPESAYPTCSPSATSMSDALHTALTLPVAAISMSFGAPESQDGSLRAAWDTYFAEAIQLGITPLAATGDLGGDALSGCRGGPSPQYPATSPDVLAVGGTSVALQRNVFGQIQGSSESAWNGSGGGVSSQFAPPTWQAGLGYSGRAGPDVSATAAENFFFYKGQPMVAAGTSFATPLWAGLFTEMDAQYGAPLSSLAPRLYSIAEEETSGRIGQGLADITSGSNCLGPAGVGFDLATGWGSPRALLLYADLTKTFVNLSISVSSSVIAPGGSVTILAHLANRTTGAPILNVPVQVTYASTSDLGPCTGTYTTVAPPTDASGNVSVSANVPWCFLGASTTATVVVLADGYYGTNSTNVQVNVLGWIPALGAITEFPYNIVGFFVIFAIASAVGYAIGRPRARAPPPAFPPGGATTGPPTTAAAGPSLAGPEAAPVANPIAGPPVESPKSALTGGSASQKP